MKKSIISLAIASCFVLGASLAQAQAITAPKPAMEQDKATPFTGKGLNTPWNCCKQYVGFDGPRDQPGEINKPGAKNNNSRNRDEKLDPGFKNDDGNRMSEFRREASTSANNEPTDSKKYGDGKDAATTGRGEGSGDTLGKSHFSDKSGYNQWVKK
jgi:hypothetical protein